MSSVGIETEIVRGPVIAGDAHTRLEGGGAVFARPVLEALVSSFADAGRSIHVACDPTLKLPEPDLAHVGRITGEAISNAIAHAFPEGRDGEIWVRLSEASDRITLVIKDNGVGMPDLQDDPNSGRGVIQALARQLGGYARLGSANFGGGEVCVVFPRNR